MNLSELILSGITPDYGRITDADYLRTLRDNIEYSISSLKEDYFEGSAKQLFTVITRLYLRNQSFLDPDILRGVIAGDIPDPSEAMALQSLYSIASVGEVATDKFKTLVDSFKKEKYRSILTSEMTRAMEQNIRGDVVSAKETLRSAIAEIESNDSEYQPSMEISQAVDLVSDDYYQTKAAPRGNRIFSGFDFVDSVSSGWQPGELIVVGGYASQGKSQYALNVAYHNSVVCQKNVLIFSLEMPIAQYARRLISRHSLHSKFSVENGIPYNAIKNGAMNRGEELKFEAIKNDFKSPEYGKLIICQMPRGVTLDDIFAKAAAYAARFPLHLIIIDYITLLSSRRKRTQSREEFADIVRDTKQLALSFNRGRGIPILALSQIGRMEYAKALKAGYYTISSFAETSEVERSSDMCVWLLRRPEDVARHALLAGIVKYRDNQFSDVVELRENFACSSIDNQDNGYAGI